MAKEPSSNCTMLNIYCVLNLISDAHKKMPHLINNTHNMEEKVLQQFIGLLSFHFSKASQSGTLPNTVS